MAIYDLHKRAAAIVQDAEGRLVGRTRLQKVTYLAQLAGFGDDFHFEYRHFGPFSDELAEAMEIATGLSLVHEEERRSDWGGRYSIYTVNPNQDEPQGNADRANFVATAAKIGAIELELAATAAFLFVEENFGKEGQGDPWAETARRKPDKAGEGRLEKSKAAYQQLRQVAAPRPLPPIA
jgi:hypothetical protein